MQHLITRIALTLAGVAMWSMIAVDGFASTANTSLTDAAPAGAGAQTSVTTATGLEAGADVAIKAATATLTLALASSSMLVVSPAAVTLTTTVAGGTLKGSITFKAGTATLGTAVINKTTAVLSVVLPPGIHSLTAAFGTGASAIASPPVHVVVDNALGCS